MTVNKLRKRHKFLCRWKKSRFDTINEAVARLNSYRARPEEMLKPSHGGGQAMEVYKCLHCQKYHIGHTPAWASGERSVSPPVQLSDEAPRELKVAAGVSS